jgi:adenylosuccinate synthase
MDQVDPIFQSVDGWDEELANLKEFSRLPKTAQDYVRLIERAAGAPVKWIGTGPARDAIIRV